MSGKVLRTPYEQCKLCVPSHLLHFTQEEAAGKKMGSWLLVRNSLSPLQMPEIGWGKVTLAGSSKSLPGWLKYF